jgi:hypothetical protein
MRGRDAVIRSGKDIFDVGQVLSTQSGPVRIVGKRQRSDYVEYVVETVIPTILTPHPAPSRWTRFKEALRVLARP